MQPLLMEFCRLIANEVLLAEVNRYPGSFLLHVSSARIRFVSSLSFSDGELVLEASEAGFGAVS